MLLISAAGMSSAITPGPHIKRLNGQETQNGLLHHLFLSRASVKLKERACACRASYYFPTAASLETCLCPILRSYLDPVCVRNTTLIQSQFKVMRVRYNKPTFFYSLFVSDQRWATFTSDLRLTHRFLFVSDAPILFAASVYPVHRSYLRLAKKPVSDTSLLSTARSCPMHHPFLQQICIRKHGALPPQKPLRLIRNGEVSKVGNLYI